MAAAIGPLAEAAHHDFTAHPAGHLLHGMAGTLLLAVAAPVALLVSRARALSRVLNSRPVRLVTHPVIAAVLNAGGERGQMDLADACLLRISEPLGVCVLDHGAHTVAAVKPFASPHPNRATQLEFIPLGVLLDGMEGGRYAS